jgi:KaiC/GvpD/RAD55 family RecA-like ATPase
VLSGEAGSGKELLTRQMMWNLLHRDAKILYFSVDQSVEELRYYMQSYGWNLAPFETTGQLKLVDVFSRSLDHQYKHYQAMNETNFDIHNPAYTLSINKLLSEIYDVNNVRTESRFFFQLLNRHQNPRLVIFDTVTPLLSTNTKGALQLLTELITDAKEAEATLLVLFHYEVHNDNLEQILKSITDATITIRINYWTSIFLTIIKYPGKHVKGPFPIGLTQTGINIIPMAMPQLL